MSGGYTWGFARDAREDYAEKYGTSDVHDAVTFIERFIDQPNLADRIKAHDSLRFVCAAWTFAAPEGEGKRDSNDDEEEEEEDE